MAKQKQITIKNIRRSNALLFTSAGVVAGGQSVTLSVREATRLIRKGYAAKVIKRRKARSVDQDADTGDSGGAGDTGGEPGAEAARDTQEI